MRQGENYNYEIIKTNHQGQHSREGVIKGETAASEYAESLTSRLTQEERDEGWSYYARRTTMPVTIHPTLPRNLKPGAFRKR